MSADERLTAEIEKHPRIRPQDVFLRPAGVDHRLGLLVAVTVIGVLHSGSSHRPLWIVVAAATALLWLIIVLRDIRRSLRWRSRSQVS